MSVLRLELHRAGLIDKMVPQAVEEWIPDRLSIDPPGGTAGHHVADQLLHLAYGAGLGALGGPMVSGRETRGGLWRGAAFGMASWAFGMLVLVPALRVARPASTTGRSNTRPISPLTWFSDGPSSLSSKNRPGKETGGAPATQRGWATASVKTAGATFWPVKTCGSGVCRRANQGTLLIFSKLAQAFILLLEPCAPGADRSPIAGMQPKRRP